MSAVAHDPHSIHIEALLRSLATTYGEMLTRFRPCKPGSEVLEQNLVSLFTHQFLRAHPNGLAFSEIPCDLTGDGKWNSRIDGYLATEDEAIFLEAKGSLSNTALLRAVAKDLERLNTSGLKDSFHTMATAREDIQYTIPEKQHVLLLADTWSSKLCKEWSEGSPLINELFPSSLKRMSFPVGQFGAYRYSVLAGWGDL